MGATGQELASARQAFGMRTVLGYRRREAELPRVRPDACARTGAKPSPPCSREADFIVHGDQPVRMPPSHLIDRAAARADEAQTAIIINLSRGGVIDEAALLEALYAGCIRGAGLDVFDPEPLPAEAAGSGIPQDRSSQPHFSAPVSQPARRGPWQSSPRNFGVTRG